ncbi:unnamed protein product [Acanthoscelides obtectus]|uniref:SEA domain-containing protein n=1 Tax=Acanthoscelides obtectus TaxID=200917 RepID=A0A9P0JTU6_ACAOB|nr:unnamed protein product [Acanthoscelides obtectus]CAK1621959.1 Basement membrane-specific heparan sulfate proteoglycan core protein [Acanthoscelides obtectus]
MKLSLELTNSNNENHHRKQKHSRIERESEHPLDKQEQEDSHWLSGTVNRIKRSISSLFSKGEDQSKHHNTKHGKREANHEKHENKEEKGKKRRDRQIGQQETVDDEYDDDNEADNVAEESAWEDNHLNIRPDDDEDSLDVQSGRGSGEIDSGTSDFPTLPHSHPRVYRFAVTIMEPYLDDYQDRNSPAFQDLARRVKRSFEEAFENVPGTQTANVISIQASKNDRFNLLATVDVDSTGYSEAEGIRSAIYDKINQQHRIGDFTVIPENFSFREFGASHPRCDQNHMPCLSGECVPIDSRCDGKQDCSDNSDEEGCVGREAEVFPHNTSVPSSFFPSRTDEPQVEGSGDGDEGNCRADDAERCADGSRIICADQKCDGHPDCDDGGDEKDCPIRECAVGEFKCDIRRCIPVDQLCDGKPDCSDHSDEQNCQCTSDEFKCNTGQCIPSSQRCDGAAQCSDNSDEDNCQSESACFAFLFVFYRDMRFG